MIITFSTLLFVKEKHVLQLKKYSVSIVLIAVLCFAQSFGLSLLKIQTGLLSASASAESEIEDSDEYLWENFQFKLEAYKKFGFWGFYTKSICNIVFASSDIDTDVYSAYIDAGQTEANTLATLYGDNLIVVLCESLDWYGIDPYNTPTLWSIAQGNNSIVFDGFYARNRTNISENISLLGSTPRDCLIKTSYEKGYNFQYSLPNLFKSQYKNTTTAYFHANDASFYNRGTTHGQDGIGFDNLYFKEQYTGTEKGYFGGQLMTDRSFVENLIEYMIPEDTQFLTYFATLSTHGDYDSIQHNFTEYYEIFDANYEQYAQYVVAENTSYIIPTSQKEFNRFRNYKTAVIDLDRTIATLISYLEEKGLQDCTSIVLFADHNSYYSNFCYNVKGVQKTDFSNTYINNIPFMIYSPHLASTLDKHTISTFCSTYDILPTICDLYGLESNTNLFQGYSIFSDEIENTIFASNLSGMFTNNIFSFNISKVYCIGDVTQEEIDAFKKNANRFWRKQEYLEKIYRYGINGT